MLAQVTEFSWLHSLQDLPLGLLLLGGIAYGAVKVTKWLGPRLESWMDRHLQSQERLVESAIAIGHMNAETLKEQSKSITGISKDMASQTAVLHRIQSDHKELTTVNKQIAEILKKTTQRLTSDEQKINPDT